MLCIASGSLGGAFLLFLMLLFFVLVSADFEVIIFVEVVVIHPSAGSAFFQRV